MSIKQILMDSEVKTLPIPNCIYSFYIYYKKMLVTHILIMFVSKALINHLMSL